MARTKSKIDTIGKTKRDEESRLALLNILEDTEEARRQAETEREKTLAIITNFTDGLLFFEKSNKLSLVNPQAKKFLDIKEEVVGKAIADLKILPHLDKLFSLTGPNLEKISRKELALRENITIEVSVVPIEDEKKMGTIIVLHDITREKTIERMKTEFVSLSAHQLRTPLSAVKWALKMLLDGDAGEITPTQKEVAEKGYQSTERMIDLINDLLNVTKIEEGRYLFNPTLVDIGEICQSVISSYQDEFKRKKLDFVFEKPRDALPKVKADSEKIGLAIQNLIDNSVRYTPVGGRITVILAAKEKEIEFRIKDTGIGVPEDQKERVFSKFFRGENVLRIDTEGSGLGLFIVKNIIEAHGGKIWFESENGEGSTFHFTVPVKEEFAEFLKEF